MTKRNKRGFTLIELLVVVAILGLLATIVAVSLTSARARARDARRVSDVRQIETALELFYAAHEEYPSVASTTALASEGFLNMSAFPTDPNTGNEYCYAAGTDSSLASGKQNQYYHIGAQLENSDSDLLSQDVDDNTADAAPIAWNWNDTEDCGGAGTGAVAGNFDGTDTVSLPTYDRGVFPN